MRQVSVGLLWVLVALYFVQSIRQGVVYWPAAKANARGLRYMDYAETLNGQEKTDQYEQAAKSFEVAIATNPTFVTSYYKLAHVYNSLGDIDKAIKTYEDLDKINPHYSEIHLNLGIMAWQKADGAEGRRAAQVA